MCSLDNVYGYITDHDIRFETYVRPYIPEDRAFWTCNGGLLAYGMLVGANGACMWLGNVAPDLCMQIVRLGFEGRFADGCELVNIDIAGSEGSCTPNKLIDLSDVLNVLDAFQGLDRCCAGGR